jgi:hypothetical protein
VLTIAYLSNPKIDTLFLTPGSDALIKIGEGRIEIRIAEFPFVNHTALVKGSHDRLCVIGMTNFNPTVSLDPGISVFVFFSEAHGKCYFIDRRC